MMVVYVHIISLIWNRRIQQNIPISCHITRKCCFFWKFLLLHMNRARLHKSTTAVKYETLSFFDLSRKALKTYTHIHSVVVFMQYQHRRQIDTIFDLVLLYAYNSGISTADPYCFFVFDAQTNQGGKI